MTNSSHQVTNYLIDRGQGKPLPTARLPAPLFTPGGQLDGPATLPGATDAIASCGLGAVKRLVRLLDDLLQRALLDLTLGDAHAHGHRHLTGGLAGPALLAFAVITRAALRITQLHAVLLDGQTHCLDVRQGLLHALAGKQQGELLTAIAVSLAATALC